MPILWHLFKYFSTFGINEFILCTGYKGNEIVKYVDTLNNSQNWKIKCVNTGDESETGERIRQVKNLINNDQFIVTYADGLSNVDLSKLIDFHNTNSTIATVTAVKPFSQYGIIEMNKEQIISRFDEKPRLPFYINGGFIVFIRTFSITLMKAIF